MLNFVPSCMFYKYKVGDKVRLKKKVVGTFTYRDVEIIRLITMTNFYPYPAYEVNGNDGPMTVSEATIECKR